MTPRERTLAVIQGRKPDQVPFVQYDGLAAPNQEIWDEIGRDNIGILRWSAVHRFVSPNCRFESEEFEREGRRGRRTFLHTTEGTLTEERIFEPALGSSSIRKHYVKESEDYAAFMAYLRDIQTVEDIPHYYRDRESLGEQGLPLVAIGRTPYQQLWIQWVSLEDLSLHRADCPGLLDECLERLANIHRAVFEIVRKAVREAAIPFIDFPDNITAPAIGVANFEKYCVPFYNELAEMLSDQDVPVFVHMDGDLKPLWEAIGNSSVGGIDSLSPPPDNDTSPGRALSMWPEMRLFVNFPSSVHLGPPEEVYRKTEELLAEAGNSGRLQIQVSENVPPGVWRNSYPQIIKAIQDFRKRGNT